MNNDKKCCENCGYQAKKWCHPKKDKICKDWCHKSDPLDAGLAERLWKIGVKMAKRSGAFYIVEPDWKKLSKESRAGWRAVATAVCKIVKEAKGGTRK